jgi:hypothetical protein
MAGPYKVLEKVGTNAYRIELPASIKVHDVVNASKLRKAADNPLPGQIEDEPPPIEVDGEYEWEVEKILGVRLLRKQLRYRVKWVGVDDDPTEYLAEDLRNSPQALRDFHRQNPDVPGPPKNLEYWLECAEKETFAEARAGDNVASKN